MLTPFSHPGLCWWLHPGGQAEPELHPLHHQITSEFLGFVLGFGIAGDVQDVGEGLGRGLELGEGAGTGGWDVLWQGGSKLPLHGNDRSTMRGFLNTI